MTRSEPEEWVSDRLAETRSAIAEQVLGAGGDDLTPELRARLEQYVAG